MREIGGFFELELCNREEYHQNSIRLNTGRNALEYIIRANGYKKVYLPYYICGSVLEPINKLDLDLEYYFIDSGLNINFDFKKIKDKELLVYVNYFGIYDCKIKELIMQKEEFNFDLCIDNTQSFFSKPMEGVHTIYSARKFFGVPDGAYLYTDKLLDKDIEKEVGFDKFIHLIKRIDLGANESYDDFRESFKFHSNQPIKEMSKLSRRILSSIDYNDVSYKRLANFFYIHNRLGKYNEIDIDIDSLKAPMVYPFLNTNINQLREHLISNGVFVAQYWKDVVDLVDKNTMEYKLAEGLTSIPIDQRYDQDDMKYICKTVEDYLNMI